MVVRRAEIKDVEKIMEIVNYEILHSTVRYDYEASTYEEQLAWFHQKQRDGVPVIVAEEDAQVVGFGTYGRFRSRDAYQFSVEHSVYVSKDSRGRGVGTALLTKLIDLTFLQLLLR